MENYIIGLAISTLASIAFLTYLSFFKVEEGHSASLSEFGRARRESNGTLTFWPSGIHVKKPWEKVHLLSLMEKTIDLQGEDHSFHTMARDGTTLILKSNVRICADPENAEAILYRVEKPMEQVQDYLTCALRSEVANFGENLDPGEVFIQLRMQQGPFLKSYQGAVADDLRSRYGVRLLGLDLVDMSPPQELAIALNSVQTARADGESMIARAKALRERKLFSAVERLKIAQLESEATEEEMKTIGANLMTLDTSGTLGDYVSRREDEVYRQAKLSIIKEGQA
ncbi:MAG: SPFH/Band 7/PHB domain protein [Bdellovibrionales bacterium]|nr:SPFH/Band 7/PHB domain protein [Oligoflexia bacterium]